MSDYQKFRGAHLFLTAWALATSGAATTHNTTGTATFSINGKVYTQAAISGGVTPTTDHVTGNAFIALVGGNSVANTPGEGCIILWGLQSDGTVVCSQGPIQALDMQGNFVKAAQFPPVSDDMAVFAYQVLKAGATAAVSVIFGTANWNATGYTNVVQDVTELPTRLQVA